MLLVLGARGRRGLGAANGPLSGESQGLKAPLGKEVAEGGHIGLATMVVAGAMTRIIPLPLLLPGGYTQLTAVHGCGRTSLSCLVEISLQPQPVLELTNANVSKPSEQ